jgi:hypothetical protein
MLLLASVCLAAEATLVVNTPMPPPVWAALERDLLRFNSLACQRFAAKYVDERGYLLHTPRWGTLDGPDDAIETFFNWTLLHALGGSDAVLQLYQKAQAGHWKQYGELRTTLTELASQLEGGRAGCNDVQTWRLVNQNFQAHPDIGDSLRFINRQKLIPLDKP